MTFKQRQPRSRVRLQISSLPTTASLDEILWALFERDDKTDGEVDLETDKAALVYLMLWAAVEALDANWTAPDNVND